jgi:hypothetical protein
MERCLREGPASGPAWGHTQRGSLSSARARSRTGKEGLVLGSALKEGSVLGLDDI